MRRPVAWRDALNQLPEIPGRIEIIGMNQVVGWFSEHRHDRVVRTAVPAFIAGSLIIYAFGVGWLWLTVFPDLGTSISKGMAPFLVGDTIKAVLGGLLLPGAWWLVDRSKA